MLLELEDVLCRKKFRERIKRAGATYHELVGGYAALAVIVEPIAMDPVILDDPDDDAVLACALAAQATVIASGDKHLLNINVHQGIRILKPAELLAEIDN